MKKVESIKRINGAPNQLEEQFNEKYERIDSETLSRDEEEINEEQYSETR